MTASELTPEAAWRAIREATASHRSVWTNGLAHTPDAQKPITEALLDALEHDAPLPATERALQGALLVLVGSPSEYRDPARFHLVTAFQVAAGGLPLAIESAIAAGAFEQRVAAHIGIYTQALAWLVAHPSAAAVDATPWVAVQAAVAAADENARAAALAFARKRADGALARHHRFALAWLFPEASELFDQEDERYGFSVDEPGDLYTLAMMRHAGLRVRAGWHLEGLPDADAIVQHLGARALPLLRQSISVEGNAARVAAIGGPDALLVLAEAADIEKTVLPDFLRAADRAPDDARAAIDQVLARPKPTVASRSRARVRPRPLLAPILAAVRARLALATGSDERRAPVEALPAALREPPWRAPRAATKRARPTKGGAAPAPIEAPDALVWGDRDPSTLFRVEVNPNGTERVQREIERSAVGRREDGGTFFLHNFFWVDDALGRRALEAVDPSRFYGDPADVVALLARFGLEALGPMLAYVKRQPDRFGALDVVDSPRVAPMAAHLLANSKRHRELGAHWLTSHPRAAAVGLVRALATEKGKAREAATLALEHVRAAHPEVVAEVLQASGATELAAEATDARKTKAIREPKLPSFLSAAPLVPPRLADGGLPLSLEATLDLLKLLTLSDRDEPAPFVSELRAAFEPSSLDAFAWSVFVPWLAAGGPPKVPVGLDVLGHFGTSATLRTLADAAREWAPGGSPLRAQAAVDVLAIAPGMDGVEGIHRLSHAFSRALARHAEKVLGAVAKKRGTTPEALLDALIPDLGFERDGTLTLTVGDRSFTVRFDDALRPVLVDEDGHSRTDLPAGEGDDEARGQWKKIKKDARAILTEQARRLELALATGRIWPFAAFAATFLEHPLLQHLVRRLLWLEVTTDDRARAFRFAEDGTAADEEDRDLGRIDDASMIALLHPLHLTKEARGRWADRLAEYGVVQPFDQLGRSTHLLDAAERDRDALERTSGAIVGTGAVLGLGKLGWTRGDSEQGGYVRYWEKRGARFVAHLTLDPGIYLGSPMDNPTQTLGPVHVTLRDDATRRLLTLGSVDPIFVSELLRDLELMTQTR